MNPARVGRYSVVGTLSKGANEDVLIGEHGSRRVAIRLFRVSDPEALLADARKVAGLSHPSIAHQDVGLHDDQPFLAAELGGQPLETWLGGDHGLPELLQVIEGIAAGLSHAHAEGVGHGCLTPARILVLPDGTAQIWGFAMPGTGPDRASSAYVAPEMLEGAAATAQADAYSAGVVLYEMLAGTVPAGETVKPLREVRKDLPKDLADAIMACRERSVDWRPKDLDYLLEVVRKARGAMPAPKPQPVARPTFEAAAPRLSARARRGPPVLPVAIGVVLALGGGVYFFLGRAETPQAPVAPSTTTATTLATPDPIQSTPSPGATPKPSAPAPSTLAALSPKPSSPATPSPTAPPTLPPARPPSPAPTTTTTLPPPEPATTLSGAPPAATTAPAPPSSAAAGPAVVRTVSPPTLRRGQRTLVDVRGQNLYPGLGAALLRNGRPAEGVRVLQERFVNATLVQVFIEVDGPAAPGPYTLLLSDGQSVTNATRFDVAK